MSYVFIALAAWLTLCLPLGIIVGRYFAEKPLLKKGN